jgi:hypothetical protein
MYAKKENKKVSPSVYAQYCSVFSAKSLKCCAALAELSDLLSSKHNTSYFVKLLRN